METGFKIDISEDIINVPYRELIGSLMYLSTISRPDILFVTSYLSRYLDKHTNSLWKAVKRVLRYLRGTKDLTLKFKKNTEDINIKAYTDADWTGDIEDSTSDFVIYYRGSLISWSSRKQTSVALTTAEAEYAASASCGAELLYVLGLATDFERKQLKCIMKIDNQSTINMLRNWQNTK
ncbi:hypothetical protein Trydic_g11676 [Trypoxylus dichotomus]